MKNAMRVEITGSLVVGKITKYTAVRLPLENYVAHWLVTNFVNVESFNFALREFQTDFSAIRANDDHRIQMLLRCPNGCVQNKFLFAVVLKLGGNVIFSDNFKRISSSSMIVSLGQLTMDDLNHMYNDIKIESTDKIYFEVFVSETEVYS